jgi:hypothetical protein
MLHISSTEILKLMYFAYFHSIMKYGIIFWGNSSHSKKILTLQKKIVRLMAGVKSRNSCKNLFKRLEILTLQCEYIFSLKIFIAKNQEMFPTNSHIHTVNTRNNNQLHRPIANLSCFQPSAYYAGIKIFDSLPWGRCEHAHMYNYRLLFRRCLSLTLTETPSIMAEILYNFPQFCGNVLGQNFVKAITAFSIPMYYPTTCTVWF